MKLAGAAVLLFFACSPVTEASFRAAKPRYAKDARDVRAFRPSGYRNAWDDCGGIGASATERMRMIAAKIKGWAKPLPFVRNAAQDCSPPAAGPVDPSGTVPGPGARVNFPGPEIPAAAREGLKTAADTLEKYPAEVKPKAEYVGYLYHEPAIE